MDCKQTREFISALVDNEIKDEETKQELEEHIQRCTSCKTEFELEKKTKEVIKSKIKSIPVPEELIQAVLAQISLIQDGRSLQPQIKHSSSPKPWLEFAFAFGVAIIVLAFAFLFISIYENKVAQRELIQKEVSGLINHFDSIANGFTKPHILSDDPNYIQNEILSKASFSPFIPQIPEFKIVGASFDTPHLKSNDLKCVNLVYRKNDKMIFIHQAPMSLTSMHEDIKKRILKGEWIYDTIEDESFALWGTNELICCAVSNLSREELAKVLKQIK